MSGPFEADVEIKLIGLILKSTANSILFYNVYFLTKELNPFSLAYSPVQFYTVRNICDTKPEFTESYI